MVDARRGPSSHQKMATISPSAIPTTPRDYRQQATLSLKWPTLARKPSRSGGGPTPRIARASFRCIRVRLTRNRRSAPHRLRPRTGVADASSHSGTKGAVDSRPLPMAPLCLGSPWRSATERPGAEARTPRARRYRRARSARPPRRSPARLAGREERLVREHLEGVRKRAQTLARTRFITGVQRGKSTRDRLLAVHGLLRSLQILARAL